MFDDYPVEVFLQRTDVLKALMDLLEGGSSSSNQNVQPGHNEWDLPKIAQGTLLVFIGKLKNLYKFVMNNTCKPSQMEKERDDSTGSQGFVDGYIEKTYPCNRLSRWDTNIDELKKSSKYGGSAKAGGQASLSAKAVLGLIITKTVYLLQDPERIGSYLQLLQESLIALETIFRVQENDDFSEFLHLCLFAFDKVCDFYREQLFDEVLIQPVLDTMINFLDLLNSIPALQKSQQL